MNYYGLWALDSRCYEQLRAMVDMNDFGLSAQGFRCYGQLGAVDNKNNSTSLAQTSKY